MRDVAARARQCLTDEARDAIAGFIAAHRTGDGGYSGRSPASDLYYCLFAAAALDAISRRTPLITLPRYLAQFAEPHQLDFVHLACLARLLGGLRARRKARALLPLLEAYRSCDGGYHHAQRGNPAASSYAIFLALETYADTGQSPPEPNRLIDALEQLQAPDGGYANDPAPRQGQTNATAAAIVARVYLQRPCVPESVEFLNRQFDAISGGFRAHPGAAAPDLLSTASALYALVVAGSSVERFAPQCRRFIDLLWTDSGGFRGSCLDPTPDPEYTFYALLSLGALMPRSLNHTDIPATPGAAK